MANVNRDALIAKQVELVALLEKELAAGKPVSAEDVAKGVELKKAIADLKVVIAAEPK